MLTARRPSLFRRYLVTLFAILFACLIAGTLASILVGEAERNLDRQSERNRLRPSPWVFAARLIDDLIARDAKAPEAALELVRRSLPQNGDVTLEIGNDAQARQVLTENIGAPVDVPGEVYAAQPIRTERFRPPHGEVVRLSTPGRFLIVHLNHPPPGGPGGRPPGVYGPPHMFWINFVSLVASLILAALISVFLLFRTMREKAKLADDVLNEMRSGNLKARFPVAVTDEIGRLMQKFNVMADEIEHLVERLRDTELRRTRLLQQLAHDLRTPVASLKNFNEMLMLRAKELSPADHGELVSLSQKEIEYVERLVEDLLFLAQVTEPNYRAGQDAVDLVELIDEELGRVGARFRQRPRPVTVRREVPESAPFTGDAHLLRRMIRNALENAYDFAKGEVTVRLSEDQGAVRLVIEDDGPGLSPEALQGFGERRGTRVLSERSGGRISVGLGSVIIKAVALAHGGSVKAENAGGARVMITIRCQVLFPDALRPGRGPGT